MINSRDLNDLHPYVKQLAEDFIAKCQEEGIEILVTSTYRDLAAQNAIYEQGRSVESKARGEKIVTNAKGGESWHNYHLAFDMVPIINGKACWADTVLWKKIGAIGESVGLEWAGRWAKFKEMPHFQFVGVLTLADAKAGKTLDDFYDFSPETA
jgi:peptidoglycan L-alanyl-D-glutamate endopeptidase CwlK